MKKLVTFFATKVANKLNVSLVSAAALVLLIMIVGVFPIYNATIASAIAYVFGPLATLAKCVLAVVYLLITVPSAAKLLQSIAEEA